MEIRDSYDEPSLLSLTYEPPSGSSRMHSLAKRSCSEVVGEASLEKRSPFLDVGSVVLGVRDADEKGLLGASVMLGFLTSTV